MKIAISIASAALMLAVASPSIAADSKDEVSAKLDALQTKLNALQTQLSARPLVPFSLTVMVPDDANLTTAFSQNQYLGNQGAQLCAPVKYHAINASQWQAVGWDNHQHRYLSFLCAP